MRIIIDTEAGLLLHEESGEDRQVALYSRESFEILSREWIRVGWSQGYFTTFTWLGVPIYQLPDDLLRVQEVIAQLRPDVIIETGIAEGGSLLYYASLCKILDHGRVIGIDASIHEETRKTLESHPLAPWITLVEGNSIDPAIVADVRKRIAPGEVSLVLLDANHSKAHVAAELEAYAPLVPPGSYIVATDGLMADTGLVPGVPAAWAWDNPVAAALEFTARHPKFVIQQPPWVNNRSTLSENVTHWPHGWLFHRPESEEAAATAAHPPLIHRAYLPALPG